ncbi:hypothetical protein KY290_005836 [Solanum tuberosum]|uniref:Uncharacterized protein n=1 Tax=Solanum tuberosum TaxID=4113 RepID=A0ABQ7WFB1_SOLTU|nr:hypothetical protein KY289_013559 [Solanum tuberosum]KAH0720847.1 hypothetical protein KY284_005877 [Solanum tuberosum]KAH0723141.1 hypothetical protein KY289_006185 [Solanum tuberosum]KAH0753349.1 hypothetical protein KY285_006497 [Solanum tuberosum]KAH0779409.1 hypothetical protein KY290_005836 [Solanum tuberosum]
MPQIERTVKANDEKVQRIRFQNPILEDDEISFTYKFIGADEIQLDNTHRSYLFTSNEVINWYRLLTLNSLDLI